MPTATDCKYPLLRDSGWIFIQYILRLLQFYLLLFILRTNSTAFTFTYSATTFSSTLLLKLQVVLLLLLPLSLALLTLHFLALFFY